MAQPKTTEGLTDRWPPEALRPQALFGELQVGEVDGQVLIVTDVGLTFFVGVDYHAALIGGTADTEHYLVEFYVERGKQVAQTAQECRASTASVSSRLRS